MGLIQTHLELIERKIVMKKKFLFLAALVSTSATFVSGAMAQQPTVEDLSYLSTTGTPDPDASTALIMVDVQHDFLPKSQYAKKDGSLAVKNGNQIVPALSAEADRVKKGGGIVVATQDWHPANHISFASQHLNDKVKDPNQSWPDHCVQGSYGAEIVPELAKKVSTDKDGPWIIQKGTKVDKDAYSGFDGTNLAERLHKKGVKTVFIGGLATDYCVRATAIDALKAGFNVYLLVDDSRGVEIKAGDIDKALLAVQGAGGILVSKKYSEAPAESVSIDLNARKNSSTNGAEEKAYHAGEAAGSANQ